ncbi:MAG: ATP-binding cassette domain-containing protein, partial [Betaproteobacteria bacterium]
MNPAPANALAINASGLVKRYGDVLAVDGLDLQIPAGQFFGLLGPNGSGKTSTIHMLATLIRPSAGSASVHGYDVVRDAVRTRASIGLVFQESALDRTLSIAENLRFAGLLYNLPSKIIGQRTSELLELFGLADKRSRPVGSLSGGMRRALDIVRGVIHHPKILFLDEPTIGLDLPNRRKIWRFIANLRSQTGMTVLLTTHYLEEADSCDRVAFIKRGKLVNSGSPAEMVASLGRYIVEIESPEVETLAQRLAPTLGPCLLD